MKSYFQEIIDGEIVWQEEYKGYTLYVIKTDSYDYVSSYYTEIYGGGWGKNQDGIKSIEKAKRICFNMADWDIKFQYKLKFARAAHDAIMDVE